MNNAPAYPDIVKKLTTSPEDQACGVKAAQALLRDAVAERLPVWELALSSLAHKNPTEARQAIQQAMTPDNMKEYVEFLLHADPGVRAVIEQALVQIAQKGLPNNPSRKLLQEAIAGRYTVPIEIAQKILDGKTTLMDFLFPFTMRPAEEAGAFHLEETVHEPDARVTAAHVSAWIYRRDGRVTHMVLSGHANMAVCKEISAKLAATRLRLGDQPAETFGVTGAALMIANSHPAQYNLSALPSKPPLEDFLGQLSDVKELTGMVQIHEAGNVTYADACLSLKKLIEQGLQKGTPTLVKPEALDLEAPAVYLPFYELKSQPLAPLSFSLNLQEFGEEFQSLLRMHCDEYYREMIADAKRRKQIYQDWLFNDQIALGQMINEMFNRLAKGFPLKNSPEMVENYLKILTRKERLQSMPWSPMQPLEDRHILMNIRALELFNYLQSRNNAPQIDLRSVLNSPGTLALQRYLPSNFVEALQSIQVQEYAVSGMRNFAEATVEMGREVHHMSLQEQVEWNLPSLINSDREWLEQMEKILKDIDDSDPKRREEIEVHNLELFIDSFLRGWPSVFLSFKSQQDRYTAWCTKQRQPVWQAIREVLLKRGLSMAPLQADNVIFNVRKLTSDSVCITPYYLTTPRTFLALLDSRLGMTCYLNPWQHRQVDASHYSSIAAKRSAYTRALEEARQYLKTGEVTPSAEGFRRAMRLYPMAAVETMLEGYWTETGRNTQPAFQDMADLVVAVVDFNHNPKKHTPVLSRFIEQYPHFLADPYLYLGFSQQEQNERWYQRQENLTAARSTYKSRIDALVHTGVLVSQRDELGNTNTYQAVGNPQSVSRVRNEIQNYQKDIQQQEEELIVLQRQMWDSIRAAPNQYVKQAMLIDPGYVATALKVGQLSLSIPFRRFVGPLYGVLRGRAFLDIRKGMIETIYAGEEDLIEKLKDKDIAQQQRVLAMLKSLVDRYLEFSYLTSEDLKPLNNVREFLEHLSTVDSITREAMIRHQFSDVFDEYLRQAFKAYDVAANTVMALSEVRRWLCDCYGLRHNYAYALNTLLGLEKMVLFNGLPNAKFSLLKTQPFPVEAITLNTATQTIDILTPAGDTLPVLQFQNLSHEEAQHLSREFQNPDFLKQIQSSGLTPAYALLYTPLKACPYTESWQKTLKELSPWLIQSFAHLAILPLEGKVIGRQEIFEHYDKFNTVDRVTINLDEIGAQFLK